MNIAASVLLLAAAALLPMKNSTIVTTMYLVHELV